MVLNGCASSPAGSSAEERAGRVGPPRAGATVERATGESFARLVLGAEQPVIVQFHASWCNHCRALEADLRDLAAAHAGAVTLVSVDIDEQDELADRHGVDSVPTLQIYAHGKRVGTVVGVRDRATLEALFESLSTGDGSRVDDVVRSIGPAEPGSACATRMPDPSISEAGTCTTPAS